jgi:hypothetical protein
MEIKENIIIQLSKEDVGQLITKYLEENGYKVTSTPVFNMGKEYSGYLDEHGREVLKNVSINVERKSN